MEGITLTTKDNFYHISFVNNGKITVVEGDEVFIYEWDNDIVGNDDFNGVFYGKVAEIGIIKVISVLSVIAFEESSVDIFYNEIKDHYQD